MKYNKRILFVSNVEYGFHALDELIKEGANIVGLITSEPFYKDHSGYFSFDDIAEKKSIPLEKMMKDDPTITPSLVDKYSPDLIILMGWQKLIKKDVLYLPEFGCIGFHPTLLPKRRGKAPITWAIIDGLKESGVTLFFLDDGADSGDIIFQNKFIIDDEDKAIDLHYKVNDILRKFMKKLLPLLEKGDIPRRKQDHSEATYTEKRTPEMGEINWNKSAKEIYNFVRALSPPYPSAFAYNEKGEKIFIKEVEIE